MDFDPDKHAPKNSSKFSGWNAALCAPLAMTFLIATAAIAEPQAAKGIIKTMTFGYVFADENLDEAKEEATTAKPAP